MDRKVLLFILLQFGRTVFISGQDLCLPDCTVNSPTGKVLDPLDCKQFYYCSDDGMPSETPFPCPDNKSFDNISKTCNGDPDCFPICGYCHLTCNGEGDFVADPFNCSLFYECGFAGPIPGPPCPGNIPNFDSISKKCVDDERKCCRPACDPLCETVDAKVPDPKDCTKYYKCTENPPYPLFPCPDGENFDIGNGVCSPTAKCTVLCPDSVVTTTTTDSGDIISTTDSSDIISTTNAVGMSTTEDSGGISTTEDSGGISTTEDSGGISTTEDSGGISTTEDSGGIFTTEDSGGSITTTDSVGFSTTADSGEVTTISITEDTTITTESLGDCFTSFMCETIGFFPKCTYCHSGYFYCAAEGQLGYETSCIEPKVFNPVPEAPFCVYPDECPYYPFDYLYRF